MIGRACAIAVNVLVLLGVSATTGHSATAPAPSCSNGNLATANLSGSPVSAKVGSAVIDSARLTNTTPATLSNASFILALLPPPGTKSGGGTPALAWRVDGGGWHSLGLSWNAPAGSGPDWQSQVVYFGSTFAPHTAHTLDIRTEFTTSSPSGDYQYDLAYSADPCNMNALGMNFEYSAYFPSSTKPKPKPTTHAPTTAPISPKTVINKPSLAPSAPHSSPAASQTPNPSPTQSAAASAEAPAAPSPSNTAQPDMQDTAAARSSDGVSAPTITLLALGILVLVLGGAYARRRLRHGR